MLKATHRLVEFLLFFDKQLFKKTTVMILHICNRLIINKTAIPVSDSLYFFILYSTPKNLLKRETNLKIIRQISQLINH